MLCLRCGARGSGTIGILQAAWDRYSGRGMGKVSRVLTQRSVPIRPTA